MDLSKLIVKVKNKQPKRLGRGVGSGTGKTSGRGNKGSGQRKGKKNPYLGHNGGNVPFFRKIPKRGFHSPQSVNYQIVNLKDIEARLKNVAEVNPVVLKDAGLIKDENGLVKILADIKGEISFRAVFKANKFSTQAKTLIENSGGKIEYLVRKEKQSA